ncbi:MAG: preprotein translocase subunit SecG, partial [Patescibacteria group bacterium]
LALFFGYARLSLSMEIASLLPYIQIFLSVILIGAVLLQQTGAGAGGAFGENANWSSAFHTRRGAERALFIATIVIAVIFALTAFISLVI